jgi:hypothetical protein
MTDDKNWAGKGYNRKNSESAGSKKEHLIRESLKKAKKQIKRGKK